jgi:hypothetical protein
VKAYYEPIEVEPDTGPPSILRWRCKTYQIRRLLDYWILQNRWWEKEEKRVYLLVETEPFTEQSRAKESPATMEIYRVGKDWKLARILD